MIKLTAENTTRAIERCKQLRPKVRFIAERVFEVFSRRNTNIYQVKFDVVNGEKLAECLRVENGQVVEQCKANKRGYVCYHAIAGATANIYRQGLKRQTVK